MVNNSIIANKTSNHLKLVLITVNQIKLPVNTVNIKTSFDYYK
jgi:hypothetical protein